MKRPRPSGRGSAPNNASVLFGGSTGALGRAGELHTHDASGIRAVDLPMAPRGFTPAKPKVTEFQPNLADYLRPLWVVGSR